MGRTARAGKIVGTRAGQPSAARAQTHAQEELEREVQRLSARVEELERERAQLENITAMAAHELLEPLIMTEAYATTVSERAGYGLDLDRATSSTRFVASRRA